MTAIQLNAELYRAMGEIADNETLLAKVLAYVKSLAPAKTAKAAGLTMMTHNVKHFSHIDGIEIKDWVAGK